MNVGNLARKYIPNPLYIRLRAITGNFQNQARLEWLRPVWMAYGLLTAVRTAKRYGINSIAVAEFGVANGRGLDVMCMLSERLEKQSGIKIFVFGFDSGVGLPTIEDFRDNPDQFAIGDYPMENIHALRKKFRGRAELIIADIGKIPSLGSVINDLPLGFASIDVDLYSSTKSVLRLFGECPHSQLLPITSLHFDDVWASIYYSKFTGELLAIDEFNEKYQQRGIDTDRFVEYWHGNKKPWHASMYFLRTFENSSRLPSGNRPVQIIEGL